MTLNSTKSEVAVARKLRDGENSAGEVAVAEHSKKTKASVRVIVADDEASARSGLARLLGDEGFAVSVAEDGLRALTLVQELAPEVLVTDLRMPGLDGIELLQRAREVEPDLIVILVTAFAEVETAVRAMQAGAEHYLTKPLQIDELLLVHPLC